MFPPRAEKGNATTKSTLPTTVATYLLNRKRKDLSELEGKRSIGITILGRDDLLPGQMEVVYDKKNKDPEQLPV